MVSSERSRSDLSESNQPYFVNNSDFVNSDDFIEKISSISIINNPNLFETLIFGPMKMNFNVKTMDLCSHSLTDFCNCFQDLVNLMD